jgi:hypothetical protein
MGHGEGVFMPFTKETAREAGKKGRAKQLSQAAECPKMSHTLRVMEHVVKKPETADRSEEQRAFRAWKKGNPSSFMIRYLDMMEQERGGQGKAKEPEVSVDRGRSRWHELFGPGRRAVEQDEQDELLLNRYGNDGVESGGVSENALGTLEEMNGVMEAQEVVPSDNTIPASNGTSVAMSSDIPGNGAAVEPAKAAAAPKPVEQTYSVHWNGFRYHWMTVDEALESIAEFLGVSVAEATKKVSSGQPIVKDVSQLDADKYAAKLRRRDIIVSVKPCPQG